MIVIKYDHEYMFYDRQCHFEQRKVDDFRHFLKTLYHSDMKHLLYHDDNIDIPKIKELRKRLLAIYDTEGKSQAIKALHDSKAICCQKYHVFDNSSVSEVLEFFAKY